MIISDKQITQLMQILRQFMSIMLLVDTHETRDLYNRADLIFCEIANQQSETLKDIK